MILHLINHPGQQDLRKRTHVPKHEHQTEVVLKNIRYIKIRITYGMGIDLILFG